MSRRDEIQMSILKQSVLVALTTCAMLVAPLSAFAEGVPSKNSTTEAPDTSNGADNFYKSDKVTVERVTFKNKINMNVVGNLFLPKNLDRSTKSAAIIVGHPMGAVKEQSAN